MARQASTLQVEVANLQSFEKKKISKTLEVTYGLSKQTWQTVYFNSFHGICCWKLWHFTTEILFPRVL